MENREATQTVKCCGIPCWKKKSLTNKENEVEVNTVDEENEKPAYSGDLPNPIHTGHYIVITGAPLKYCDRFAINFKCGKLPKSDIALHFNPRLTERYVVRNSQRHGQWDNEETTASMQCELPWGQTFIIGFFFAPNQFMITLNDQHFCTFDYRIAITKLKFLEVCGEVTVENVETTELKFYPRNCYANLYTIPFKDESDGSVALPNPFIGHLERAFQIGWQLEIHGKVKLLPIKFFVCIQDGSQQWPQPLIALQLISVFDHTDTLIRNTFENGRWGTEERASGFQFAAGKPFQLIIQMEAEQFVVWVNGQLQTEFRYRTSIKNLNTVRIYGDLFIYKVFMKEACTNMIVKHFS